MEYRQIEWKIGTKIPGGAVAPYLTSSINLINELKDDEITRETIKATIINIKEIIENITTIFVKLDIYNIYNFIEYLGKLFPEERAAALAAMSPEDREATLAAEAGMMHDLSPAKRAAALSKMSPEQQAEALAAMSPEDAAAALAAMSQLLDEVNFLLQECIRFYLEKKLPKLNIIITYKKLFSENKTQDENAQEKLSFINDLIQRMLGDNNEAYNFDKIMELQIATYFILMFYKKNLFIQEYKYLDLAPPRLEDFMLKPEAEAAEAAGAGDAEAAGDAAGAKYMPQTAMEEGEEEVEDKAMEEGGEGEAGAEIF